MAKWGLLAGVGHGFAKMGEMGVQDTFDRMKEERLKKYQEERDAVTRANAKEDLIENREYAESKTATDVSVEQADGKQIKVGKNAKGEVVSRQEDIASADYSYAKKVGNKLIDMRDGSVIAQDDNYSEYETWNAPEVDANGNPLYQISSRGKINDLSKSADPMVKARIDSINADIKALSTSDPEGNADQIWQLKQQRNKIVGLESEEGWLSPTKDAELMTKAEKAAASWADEQAGLLSSDKADFKRYGGNKQEAIQKKTLEFYQQYKDSMGGGNGLLKPRVETPEDKGAGYGERPDGSAKQSGFLGELKLPDGGVATEYSVGVKINGKQMDIPTLVPTLTKSEVDMMVNDIIPNRKRIPDSVMQKAADHAKSRLEQGESVFYEGESSKTKQPEMNDMPDAAQHSGRMIRDEETGKLYKSDGKTWKPL